MTTLPSKEGVAEALMDKRVTVGLDEMGLFPTFWREEEQNVFTLPS